MTCVHLYRVSDCVNVIACGRSAATAPLILAGTKSDYLRLLDIRQEANTHCLMAHREQVVAACWSNTHAHQLVTADVEGSVFVWDIRKPIPLLELGTQAPPEIRGPIARSLTDGGAPAQRKRPKLQSRGDRAVSAVLERTAGVAKKGATCAHADSVNAVCFGGHGGLLVTYSMRDCIKVWDVHNQWALVRRLSSLEARTTHPLLRLDLAVSDDPLNSNHRMLVGNGTDLVSIPLGPTGRAGPREELLWWPAHSLPITSVQYNSRTQRAYSGGQDGVVHVWRHATPADAVRPEAGAAAAAAAGDNWRDQEDSD